MLKQARSRFNMIRRMLSAHPSDVLSPKEQINLGQYGKINKVCCPARPAFAFSSQHLSLSGWPKHFSGANWTP